MIGRSKSPCSRRRPAGLMSSWNCPPSLWHQQTCVDWVTLSGTWTHKGAGMISKSDLVAWVPSLRSPLCRRLRKWCFCVDAFDGKRLKQNMTRVMTWTFKCRCRFVSNRKDVRHSSRDKAKESSSGNPPTAVSMRNDGDLLKGFWPHISLNNHVAVTGRWSRRFSAVCLSQCHGLASLSSRTAEVVTQRRHRDMWCAFCGHVAAIAKTSLYNKQSHFLEPHENEHTGSCLMLDDSSHYIPKASSSSGPAADPAFDIHISEPDSERHALCREQIGRSTYPHRQPDAPTAREHRLIHRG